MRSPAGTRIGLSKAMIATPKPARFTACISRRRWRWCAPWKCGPERLKRSHSPSRPTRSLANRERRQTPTLSAHGHFDGQDVADHVIAPVGVALHRLGAALFIGGAGHHLVF